MYIYTCKYIYIHLSMCVYSPSPLLCRLACLRAPSYIYIYTLCTYTCIYIYLYININIYIYREKYMYIYTCIYHIYTYIYKYVYGLTESFPPPVPPPRRAAVSPLRTTWRGGSTCGAWGKSEVDALGVITISRGCFERCCSNKKNSPIHPF